MVIDNELEEFTARMRRLGIRSLTLDGSAVRTIELFEDAPPPADDMTQSPDTLPAPRGDVPPAWQRAVDIMHGRMPPKEDSNES